MTAQRWITKAPFDAERRRTKRKICRWCGKDVPKHRRKWCSADCVGEFMVRHDAQWARAKVFTRDRGVCAMCGFDAGHTERLMRNTGLKYLDQWGLYGILARHGFDVRRSLWDADHIVPVIEGGGGCGLENYRTLCQLCHKKETAQLAARRAAMRKLDEKQEPISPQ